MTLRSLALSCFLAVAGVSPAFAQAHGPDSAAAHEETVPAAAPDIITPHITDSRALEVPCLDRAHGFACHVELPRWEPLHIGGLTIDLSPTKHVVFLVLAAVLATIVLLSAAAAHRRHTHATGVPKGFAAGIEALVLYMRNEVILPNVGHHGEKYVPFVLTLFFLILFANLLGLIPFGSTATGNISVTATLAIITFVVVEVAGMRALGPAYLKTIFYWPHDMPLLMKLPMTLIMTPVEIVGKFTKPFALAIRLFANMTAGHVVLLALIGLIFTFGSYFIAGGPVLMSVAIMLLELFVAFLQAFIFSLLASVFIGQIREGAH
ncbi:MAG TPA: F0F1 ATP synthase subunit A [Gemmatimonadaceae bacterium]|nr:F0F1 ATP synthase subunit A [Gemmatimonadaceae bacterium]